MYIEPVFALCIVAYIDASDMSQARAGLLCCEIKQFDSKNTAVFLILKGIGHAILYPSPLTKYYR